MKLQTHTLTYHEFGYQITVRTIGDTPTFEFRFAVGGQISGEELFGVCVAMDRHMAEPHPDAIEFQPFTNAVIVLSQTLGDYRQLSDLTPAIKLRFTRTLNAYLHRVGVWQVKAWLRKYWPIIEKEDLNPTGDEPPDGGTVLVVRSRLAHADRVRGRGEDPGTECYYCAAFPALGHPHDRDCPHSGTTLTDAVHYDRTAKGLPGSQAAKDAAAAPAE